MAAVRHNRPTIIVYGGTIQHGVRRVDCPALGHKTGDDMNVSDAFESYGMPYHPMPGSSLHEIHDDDDTGAFVTGKISDEERFDVVRHSCPGPGACGGMFTYVLQPYVTNRTTYIDNRANTMSSALEVLGMSLPYSSSTPATFPGMPLPRNRRTSYSDHVGPSQRSRRNVIGQRSTCANCSSWT